MSKKVLSFVLFLCGVAVGYFTNQYYNISKPQETVMQVAKKQQQELEQMMLNGKVLALKANELIIEVNQAGDKKLEKKTITVNTDNRTSVLKGAEPLNVAGKAVDLTKYLNTGTQVDALITQDKALAIHWDTPGGPETTKIKGN